jgi:hypothetical protein
MLNKIRWTPVERNLVIETAVTFYNEGTYSPIAAIRQAQQIVLLSNRRRTLASHSAAPDLIKLLKQKRWSGCTAGDRIQQISRKYHKIDILNDCRFKDRLGRLPRCRDQRRPEMIRHVWKVQKWTLKVKIARMEKPKGLPSHFVSSL